MSGASCRSMGLNHVRQRICSCVSVLYAPARFRFLSVLRVTSGMARVGQISSRDTWGNGDTGRQRLGATDTCGNTCLQVLRAANFHKLDLRPGDDHAKNKQSFCNSPAVSAPLPAVGIQPLAIQRRCRYAIEANSLPYRQTKARWVRRAGASCLPSVTCFYVVDFATLVDATMQQDIYATKICAAKACATRVHLQIKLPSKLSVVFSFTPVRDTSCLS